MAFTATGNTLDPSAAYAPIDAVAGAGPWNVVAEGAAQHDGLTVYEAQVGNPPQTRWGNYGAAPVDGNSIWIGSEYMGHACAYTDWGWPFRSSRAEAAITCLAPAAARATVRGPGAL